MRSEATARAERPIAAFPARALLFLSGSASLVFETLWVKQLGLVVGVDVHAVTIAISAFFAGLALGAWLLGGLADRSANPVRLYAWLEMAAGLLGALATLGLARSAGAFVAFQGVAGPVAYALPFALVGLPAVAMGGTLPALTRALRPPAGSVSHSAGLLYTANTAGAIAGTLATPLALVPTFGVLGTGAAAGLVDLAAAVLAIAWSRTLLTNAPPRAVPSALEPGARLVLALYAIAGGLAMGYQVVWSQAIVPFLSTRTYAFAVLLGTYLAGLVAGSALGSRFAARLHRPWLAFGALVAGAGLVALAALAAVGPWLSVLQDRVGAVVYGAFRSDLLDLCSRFATAAVATVLPSTLLLGAAFPTALRLAAGAERVGRDVGSVTAWNTWGGIAGTLLTGFVLVPSLGLTRTLLLLAAVAVVVGVVAISREALPPSRAALAALASAGALVALGLALPRDTVARYVARKSGGTTVFQGESAGGSVVVLEQSTPRGSFRRLYIDGVSNSGDTLTSLRYMRLQALLPLLIHRGEPRAALVVGLGTGITAGALLTDPGLERREVIELLPAVVRAAPLFHGNLGAAADPRLRIRLGDGRLELLRDPQAWDVLTLEPPPPSAAGVVNLYSTDFYRLCRRRLAPGGLMAQWWPLPTQNDEASRSLVRSFLDAFPHATLWTTELHEMLLVGSADPIELDGARIAERFASGSVAAVLSEVGIGSPAALLATWVTDRAGLEAYAGDALPVTDDRPRIEHAGWVRPGEFERVLPRVLETANDPPLREDDALVSATTLERRRLLLFYAGTLAGLRRDREEWSRAMNAVLSEDPKNPYYGWFLGSAR
jgi:predicted membrane-bound spermidine synthase